MIANWDNNKGFHLFAGGLCGATSWSCSSRLCWCIWLGELHWIKELLAGSASLLLRSGWLRPITWLCLEELRRQWRPVGVIFLAGCPTPKDVRLCLSHGCQTVWRSMFSEERLRPQTLQVRSQVFSCGDLQRVGPHRCPRAWRHLGWRFRCSSPVGIWACMSLWTEPGGCKQD